MKVRSLWSAMLSGVLVCAVMIAALSGCPRKRVSVGSWDSGQRTQSVALNVRLGGAEVAPSKAGDTCRVREEIGDPAHLRSSGTALPNSHEADRRPTVVGVTMLTAERGPPVALRSRCAGVLLRV